LEIHWYSEMNKKACSLVNVQSSRSDVKSPQKITLNIELIKVELL